MDARDLIQRDSTECVATAWHLCRMMRGLVCSRGGACMCAALLRTCGFLNALLRSESSRCNVGARCDGIHLRTGGSWCE